MKAKEIIILILVVAAGIFFTHAKTGKLRFDWEDYVALGWNAYTFEESGVIEAPLPALLKVTNAHGSVEIAGATEDRITFTLKKKIWRRNEARARQVAESLHPIFDRDGEAIKLSTNRSEFKKRNFETSFRITCPENMGVEVMNSHGLVKVEAVGNSVISNRHGRVVATDVRGEVELENTYEPVELENIQSRCRVKSRHADVTARSVRGEMAIETSYARIDLRDIEKKVTVNAPHTAVVGQNLAGGVEIQNSYEPITLLRVGPVDIRARHCSVEADEVGGNVRIDNRYGRVKLNDVRGSIWISGKNLALDGRAIIGEEIHVSSSYEDVELVDFSGKATVAVSHGKVLLSPLPLTAPLDVRCDYSPIVLYWPEEEKYPLEARTKNGKIQWRLPGEIHIEEEDNLTTARAFVEMGDRPKISLFTTYSNIRLEAGSPR